MKTKLIIALGLLFAGTMSQVFAYDVPPSCPSCPAPGGGDGGGH